MVFCAAEGDPRVPSVVGGTVVNKDSVVDRVELGMYLVGLYEERFPAQVEELKVYGHACLQFARGFWCEFKFFCHACRWRSWYGVVTSFFRRRSHVV